MQKPVEIKMKPTGLGGISAFLFQRRKKHFFNHSHLSPSQRQSQPIALFSARRHQLAPAGRVRWRRRHLDARWRSQILPLGRTHVAVRLDSPSNSWATDLGEQMG
jgi:hypothetical protein